MKLVLCDRSPEIVEVPTIFLNYSDTSTNPDFC